MDHDEIREQLELAAAEPGGIDRLMAGDTPVAAAVASHLAGCPTCTEELARLRVASQVIGAAIRSTPPADLRERTLAYVREYGRVVPVPAGAAAGAGGAGPALTAMTAAGGPAARRGARRLGWAAPIAAALVVAVAGTAVVMDSRSSEQLAAQESRAAGLARITGAFVALSAEPDLARVQLAAPPGEAPESAAGTLAYSPAKAELVVIAEGLTEPSSELEYRCWVEVDGARSSVGKMFFGGGLAFWAGRVDAVADLPAGATFGVSLVEASGDSLAGPAVLAGVVGS
jgi:hypothetical protein